MYFYFVVNQTARFKENELARMRLEERETSRKEIDKARREVCILQISLGFFLEKIVNFASN